MTVPFAVINGESISADGNTENFDAGLRGSPEITWIWEFTQSGSGTDAVKFTPKIPLNYESPGETQVYSEIDNTRAFDWPLWINDEMITDAGGTLRILIVNPNVWTKMRLDYDYGNASGGTRVFDLTIKLVI